MKLPINWFDFALPAMLVIGVLRGRKHGMSEELLLLLKWIAIIVACGFGYELLGDTLSEMTFLNRLQSYLAAYIGIAVVVALLFWGLKKLIHGKLVGSDVFGSMEYYLGMVAGLLRYACISMFILAIANAPLYTTADIRAREAYQAEWYGSDFFPGFESVQSAMLVDSFSGPYIKQGLGFLMIKSTRFESKSLRRGKEVELPGT